MSSCISAIGTANPKYRIPQNDIYHFMVKAFKLNDTNASRLKRIYDHSGIEHRYSVIPDFGEKESNNNTFFGKTDDFEPFPGTRDRLSLYQDSAADLASEAVNDCISNHSEIFTPTITHLITVSCTGMHAPGIDIELVEKLGLNPNIERTCINFMGCYGSLNALKVADYICRADPRAKVLIVSVELCTLHFQKENTLDNWVANSLFSDGAAAVIVENSTEIKTRNKHLLLDTFYSEFLNEAKNEMGWYVGDAGFEMKLTSKVSRMILKHIQSISNKLLNKAGLKFKDISRFAVHPGGRKILEAAESALGFSSIANCFAYETLRDYGNMSSSTILFVLKKLMDDPEGIDGENILGFAFGPGLTVESMILKKEAEMPDFSRRSSEEEMMDDFSLGHEIIDPIMDELEVVNKLLGGYNVFFDAFQKIGLKDGMIISDWGCGGGDSLRVIAKWARKRKLKIRLIGVDATESAIEYAREKSRDFPEISYILTDVMSEQLINNQFDIVISSLFTHHFADESWIRLIQKMADCAAEYVVINDLHRHWFAYHSIGILTSVFSKSEMVKHDSKLSVLRSFKREELEKLLKKGGFKTFSIKWMWAFRWQICIETGKIKERRSI